MRAPSNRLDLAAMLIMLALCGLWGLNQVSIKIASAGVSPMLQAGMRSTGAALLLWGWSSAQGVPLVERDNTLWLGVLIAVLFAGEFGLLYGALQFTTASRSVVFLYLAPFVVALGGHFMIPGEKLRPIHVAGLVSAFIGMAVAFADALRLPTYSELLGDVMALGAAIFWGLTTVAVKATRLVRLAPHKALFYQLVFSAPLLFALSLLFGERGAFRVTPGVIGALLFQTVLVAFVSYLTWFWLIRSYPAFKLAAFSFLTPLFGVIAGGAVLGEPITPALAAALALVAAGIYLVNRTPPAAATRSLA